MNNLTDNVKVLKLVQISIFYSFYTVSEVIYSYLFVKKMNLLLVLSLTCNRQIFYKIYCCIMTAGVHLNLARVLRIILKFEQILVFMPLLVMLGF